MKILNSDTSKEKRDKDGKWTSGGAAAAKSEKALSSSEKAYAASRASSGIEGRNERERIPLQSATKASAHAESENHEKADKEHADTHLYHLTHASEHEKAKKNAKSVEDENRHREAMTAHKQAAQDHQEAMVAHREIHSPRPEKKIMSAKSSIKEEKGDHSTKASEATKKASSSSKTAYELSEATPVGDNEYAGDAYSASGDAGEENDRGRHNRASQYHDRAADLHARAADQHREASLKARSKGDDKTADLHDKAEDAHLDGYHDHNQASSMHYIAHEDAQYRSAHNRAPILNRDFTHPEDGWYHIEPKGEHPNRAADIVQVIDAEACEAIVNRFNADAEAGKLSHGKEMLIDHEHFKHDSNKETRAFGWLTKLENREDGLYGQIRWSTTGKEAVDGGDYRFFSTEYDPKNLTVLNKEAKTVRPMVLDGLTLTNQPNNRGGRPITNSDRNPAPQPADNPKQKTMKLIAASLGLSADASENAIVDELVRLQNRAAQLDAEQIDADLAAHGVKEETVINRLKPVLAEMNNREERLSFLADVVKPAASAAEQKKLLNRDGKAPSKEEATSRENAVKISNRAAELRKGCPTMTQASAFIQAKAEIEG